MNDNGMNPTPVAGTAAHRVDHEGGFREDIEFFGSGTDRMLGIRCSPVDGGPVGGGVVLCSPVLAQFYHRYRREVLLARSLARRGLVVQRFHYRGMGNSDGDPRALTLETMREDVYQAKALLRANADVKRLAFLGVSVGALVAASASGDGDPLVLDSPVVSGRKYLSKAFRSHMVAMMKEEGGKPTTTEEMIARLESTDDLSLLGFRLSRSLYESLADRRLTNEFGDTPRPILMIESGRDGALMKDVEELAGQLRERGFSIDVALRPKEDPFWYVDNSAPEDLPEEQSMVLATGDWISDQLTQAPPSEIGVS